jgi:hypothetical protein
VVDDLEETLGRARRPDLAGTFLDTIGVSTEKIGEVNNGRDLCRRHGLIFE